MAGRQTQNRKLCQNIFDVHRFDLLNVLETLREAFYMPVESEPLKQEVEQEDKATITTTLSNTVATNVSLIPEAIDTPTPPAPATRGSTPSLRAKTATPPPVTPDAAIQRASAPQDNALPSRQRRFSTPRTSSLPPPSVKAIPIFHIQRNLIQLIKKEPTKYDESEIMKIISQVFRIDSNYTRVEQLHLIGTLAIVAKGMRKARVVDRLSQARAGLLQS